MKLKYFISFFALVAMLSACSDDDSITLLDEIKVSSSYVSIDEAGGSNTITLTASEAWTFDAEELPDWLTISPMNGGAGETQVTFTAPATPDGRTAILHVECAGKKQTINVIQGLAVVSDATCAQVIEGPESKTYRVTGTITSWGSNYEKYGNMNIADETGTIYIYGMADKNGKLANNPVASWGLEVGDIITVEGPKQVYNGTVELVDVTVINIQKSLIKVEGYDPEDATIPVEGGNVTVNLTCKTSNGISVEIPEDAKDWLGIVSIAGGAEPVVTFHAGPNMGGDRNTTVVFKTTDGSKEYTAQAVINQKGSIVACTVGEFLEAQVGDTQYRMTGVLTSMYIYKDAIAGFYIRDWSGETLVYKPEGFTGTEAKVGDIVTVVGKRGEYKGAAQMVSGLFEELVHSVTQVTIEQFLAQEDNPDVYYMVTGTIESVDNPVYGNVYIVDGTGKLYVYGTYPGWGATGDNRKNWLETAGIEVGDELSVIGIKKTFNGTPQLSNGIYFSHEKGD